MLIIKNIRFTNIYTSDILSIEQRRRYVDMAIKNVTDKMVAVYNSYLKNIANRSSVKRADLRAEEFAVKGFSSLTENMFNIPSVR